MGWELTSQDLALWLSLALGGYGIPKIVHGVYTWATGAKARKRDDADKAWNAADDANRKRRLIEVVAHDYLLMLRAADCVNNEDIPPWPSRGADKKEENE